MLRWRRLEGCHCVGLSFGEVVIDYMLSLPNLDNSKSVGFIRFIRGHYSVVAHTSFWLLLERGNRGLRIGNHN